MHHFWTCCFPLHFVNFRIQKYRLFIVFIGKKRTLCWWGFISGHNFKDPKGALYLVFSNVVPEIIFFIGKIVKAAWSIYFMALAIFFSWCRISYRQHYLRSHAPFPRTWSIETHKALPPLYGIQGGVRAGVNYQWAHALLSKKASCFRNHLPFSTYFPSTSKNVILCFFLLQKPLRL